MPECLNATGKNLALFVSNRPVCLGLSNSISTPNICRTLSTFFSVNRFWLDPSCRSQVKQ